MDAFQSTPALIRSARTLAQSVSAPPIIIHDCCDLVPTPRQLELRLRTISYRTTEPERRRGEGGEGEIGRKKIQEVRKWWCSSGEDGEDGK